MQTVLTIVVPVFLLLALGYGFARTPLLRPEGIKGLSNFVVYVALPALLFKSIAVGPPVPAGADPATSSVSFGLIYAYFSGCLIVFGVTMVIGRVVFRTTLAERSLMALSATFGNTVQLGIPLIFTAFGTAGELPALLIISFHSIILLSLATILVEVGEGEGSHALRVLRRTVVSLASHPVISGMVVGLAYHMTGWPLPTIADRFLGLLGGAAQPCALFTLGASLTLFRLGGDMREVLTVTALKLFVLPLLIWFLATEVFAVGPLEVAVATIMAAMPVGANPFLLAQHYGIYVARSASSVVISTALSVVILSILMAHYAPQP